MIKIRVGIHSAYLLSNYYFFTNSLRHIKQVNKYLQNKYILSSQVYLKIYWTDISNCKYTKYIVGIAKQSVIRLPLLTVPTLDQEN